MSVDAVLESSRARSEKSSHELDERPVPAFRFRSFAVVAMVVSWAAISLVDFAHAWGPSFRDGSALHYLLQQDAWITPAGAWLSQHAPAGLLAAIGRVGYWALALIALLLLVPGRKSERRRAALLVAALLYGALALFSTLDLLAWVRFIPFVLLLGSSEIQLLGRWFGRKSRAKTVIFDADCGICLFTCRILARLDPFRRLSFVGNDEDDRIVPSVDRALLETSVVVLDARGRVWSEERAVMEIGRALPFGFLLLGWLGIPGLAGLGRRGYRAIADNRILISSWLGLGACGVAPPPAARAAVVPPPGLSRRFGALAREAFGAIALLLLLSSLLADSPWLGPKSAPPWAPASRRLRLVGLAGRLGPEPPRTIGRMVVDATLPDGSHVDPLTGHAPRLDDAGGAPLSPLWAEYTGRLQQLQFQHHRALFRDWLLTRHEPNPVALTVWWVRAAAPPPGARRSSPLAPEKIFSVARRAPLPGLGP